MIREQGWECPKCQRIWAPKISSCGYCNILAGRQKPLPAIDTGDSRIPPPRWNWGADDESYVD